MRLMYRVIHWLRARRLAAEDAAIETEWRRTRPSHANHGDRSEFYRRMRAR